MDKTIDQVYAQRNILAQALSARCDRVGVRDPDSDWPVLAFFLPYSATELSFHIPREEWNAGYLEYLKHNSCIMHGPYDNCSLPKPWAEWDEQRAALQRHVEQGYTPR